MEKISTNIPLVSIALCTYNGEKYLTQQLDSLLAQDYTNLEIVIVDDASTDDTFNILKAFEKKHTHIRLIQNEKNLGFNENFKKAIELCTGEYIAIADQDDIWLAYKISKMMRHIGDDLLLYHDSANMYDNGFSSTKSTRTFHRFVAGKCAENLLFYNCVSGHTCLFNKALWAQIPPFPTHFYYDWWMAYTAACLGKLNYIKDKLVNHRLHADSSTYKDKKDPKLQRVYHLNLFLNHPLTPSKIKRLLTKLLNGYQKLEHKNFSVKLFITLIRNARNLFCIRKKSIISQFKFIVNESSK